MTNAAPTSRSPEPRFDVRIGIAALGASAGAIAVARLFLGQAPVTGIILAIELTGSFTPLLPMLWACFAAMALPTLLGGRPNYDSLKERTLRIQR